MKRRNIPAGTPFTIQEMKVLGLSLTGSGRTHGTKSGYVSGCRCLSCTYANTAYANARRRQIAEHRWKRRRT